MPPENWKQKAVRMYIHGCSARGTHLLIMGMLKPIWGGGGGAFIRNSVSFPITLPLYKRHCILRAAS